MVQSRQPNNDHHTSGRRLPSGVLVCHDAESEQSMMDGNLHKRSLRFLLALHRAWQCARCCRHPTPAPAPKIAQAQASIRKCGFRGANVFGERQGSPRSSQPNGYAVRLRGRCRDVLPVRREIVRKASFTARALGKISATSGSRRTKLVPSAYRAAVTPRTALEKSYSGRMVSSSDPSGRALLLFFFILFPFMSSCQPGGQHGSEK